RALLAEFFRWTVFVSRGVQRGWPMGEVRKDSQAETFKRTPVLRLSRGQNS
ncbi:mCG1042694, partial [Mus musculus]